MVYVTSDLHGYSKEKFLKMLSAAGFRDEDILYVLGDVIDRNGDGGVSMLQWMMEQKNVHLIRGNHEEMMLKSTFLFDEITEESVEEVTDENFQVMLVWMENGADCTIEALRKLSAQERHALFDYVRKTPYYELLFLSSGSYLLCHAGLGNFRPSKKITEYTMEEWVWYRPDPEEKWLKSTFTVFGHTPTVFYGVEDGKMFETETWADIDTGAAGGGSPMLLRLDDRKAFYA